MDKNILKVYNAMEKGRFWITLITMLIFVFIILGIGYAMFSETKMVAEWEKILLLILGTFIASYGRVIDYWFNNPGRDERLIDAVDEVNGTVHRMHKHEMQNSSNLKVCDDCGDEHECTCDIPPNS